MTQDEHAILTWLQLLGARNGYSSTTAQFACIYTNWPMQRCRKALEGLWRQRKLGRFRAHAGPMRASIWCYSELGWDNRWQPIQPSHWPRDGRWLRPNP